MKHDEFTIGTADYRQAFWDKAMRGVDASYATSGGEVGGGMLVLPHDSGRKYTEAMKKEGFFRRIATCVNVPRSDENIWMSNADSPAQWVPEGGVVEISDADEFVRHTIHCSKLAVITRLDNDLTHDIGFDLEDYLVRHLAKRFTAAEENAFLNGTEEDMPTGILHDTEGAEIGVSTESITFDDVIRLYLSVKPEYRRRGCWVMNDESALLLRTLKDADGGYLWNHNSDTILGKPVYISEHIPNVEPGKKPIAFGDFSYYWVIIRSPVSVRTLQEKFVFQQQTGYLAQEFLDGRLIRPEAVKVLQMTEQ